MPKESNLKPFPPGKSGNPRGRPKKLPELDVLLGNVLGEKQNGITAAEAILKKLRQLAAQGNIRAAEVLLNRAYGMPKQKQEHEVSNTQPVQIVIRAINEAPPPIEE